MEPAQRAAGQLNADAAMQIAESFTGAWNRHDIEAMMALFHPQATLTCPALPGPVTGEALRAYLAAQHAAYPDIKVEVVGEQLLGRNTISGRHLVTGTWTRPMTVGPLAEMSPTGKRFTLHSADFLDIKEGKIAAWTQYYDRLGLMAQMGILPQNLGR